MTSDDRSITLDVVVPIYNELDCVDEFVREIAKVRETFSDRATDVRLLFVDDGSTDGTTDATDRHAAAEPWIDVVHFSRNFGHQAAVTAGLHASTGDLVCVIDADLQDPPSVIVEMADALGETGSDIVYGVRSERRGESRFKLRTAQLFYVLLRRLSGLEIPLDTGDFRVMTRRVVDALNDLPEHHRLMRALVPWLGYPAVGLPYTRVERFAGTTKYSTRRMVALAVNTIIAFSTAPIRVIQMLGLALTALGAVALLTTGVLDAGDAWSPSATAWIAMMLVVHTGIVSGSVGIVGGYVSRIQDEVKGRPLYVRADGSRAVPSTSEGIAAT